MASNDATGEPAVLAAIRTRLAALSPQVLELHDESGAHIGHEGAKGGGGHYRLLIVAAAFAGQPRVKRHRLVYQALGGMMRREIHALALTAYAPEELAATPPV